MSVVAGDEWRPKPSRDDPRNVYQHGYSTVYLWPDGQVNIVAEDGERVEREWLAGVPHIRMTMLPSVAPSVWMHGAIRGIAHSTPDADARLDAYNAYVTERDAPDV